MNPRDVIRYVDCNNKLHLLKLSRSSYLADTEGELEEGVLDVEKIIEYPGFTTLVPEGVFDVRLA